MHVDSWGKLIDPRATARHHTYAIVADNTLASIWNDLAMLREAITEIETANSEVTPIDFTISNMVWLNSQEAHDKTRRGPLMISLKSKNATNAAIDLNLAIHGITCSISIYIPWLPECFWYQDWGHCVMECTGEECCSHCTGPHAIVKNTAQIVTCQSNNESNER